MEHSYNRDNVVRPSSEITGLAPARTIIVRRPPQCPACHTHPLDEHELEDGHEVEIPAYNEISAKEAMSECQRIAKYVKNSNPDDLNWEERVSQYGWSRIQKTVFSKIVRILDNDQLGRLAHMSRPHEPMQRRVLVDKSASRVRKVFASISWDPRLTQWLHCLLMDSLPSTYMASYLDILQTLKAKVPSLMDKMLFARPLNVSQELLAPVMKKPWEPTIATQPPKLTQNAVILTLPLVPTSGTIPHRIQEWYKKLEAVTQVVHICLPANVGQVVRQPLEHVAEQIVTLARVRIQELRNEDPMRSIIVVGFNAGAAFALQVCMSEHIACCICMGFAYNTFNGVRGGPDDRILDIKVPILFVIGQNSSRSSPEEIESLREKMQSETSFVIVGSADDMLRVPKSRRKIENVTQAMVDMMIIDEVTEFIRKTLTNPPGTRIPTAITSLAYPKLGKNLQNVDGSARSPAPRKRKIDNDAQNSTDQVPAKSKCMTNKIKKIKKPIENENVIKRKVGRPRTRPVMDTSNCSGSSAATKTNQQSTTQKLQTTAKTLQISPSAMSNDDLNIAIQSILSEEQDSSNNSTNSKDGVMLQSKQVTNFELVAQSSSTPIKTALINHANLQKQTAVYSGNSSSGNTSTPLASKIKLIPPNQFVQLKPTTMPTQSKVYTFKTTGGTSTATNLTATNITSIVRQQNHQPQQQIFTLKSPNGQTTQFVTGAPPMTQQRYTVVKGSNIGSTIQLSSSAASTSTTTSIGSRNVLNTAAAASTSNSNSSAGGMDLSNIIDMPIVFADSDGNLTDTVASSSTTTTTTVATTSSNIVSGDSSAAFKTVGEINAKKLITPTTNKSNFGQLIISQKIIKEANAATNNAVVPNSTPRTASVYTINTAKAANTPGGGIQQKLTNPPQSNIKTSKFVFINRNNMKPCPGILARSANSPMPKYTKVVVATKQTPLQVGTVNSKTLTTSTSNIKQLSVQQMQPIGGTGTGTNTNNSSILNVLTKSLPAVQIIGSSAATTTSGSGGGGEQKIRNIVVQPGGLKQIPPHLKNQLLNRNLTVRKLVNIVPVQKNAQLTTVVNSTNASNASNAVLQQDSSSTAATTAATTTVSGGNNSNTVSLQSAPKIITLNPINRLSSPPSPDKHE